MDTDAADARTRKALQDLSRDLRVSLSAILGHTAALRTADDRDALLDAIEREGNDALHAMDRTLDACRLDGTASGKQSRAGHTSKAYIRWIRSRLEQIETCSREGRSLEVERLALQLKESAASMGYVEIAEAAAAVQRLSETQGQGREAAVEILRRVVNRALRRGERDAA